MVSYVRYSSYYVHTLKNMETLRPGLKDMLEKTGLSFQAQHDYQIRTVLNQRENKPLTRTQKHLKVSEPFQQTVPQS